MDNLVSAVEQLNMKIRFGKDAIRKAQAEGKDVAEWEKIIADLEDQMDRITEEIYRRGRGNKNSRAS